MTSPLRLVTVDDHQMVLDGLRAMLRPYREQVQIVGESSDSREAAQLISELEPDVCVMFFEPRLSVHRPPSVRSRLPVEFFAQAFLF